MELFKREIFTRLLKRNKNSIAAGIILFIIGSVAGYIFYLGNPGIGDPEESPVFSALKEKFSFFETLNTPGKILFIFLNNLLVVVLSIFLGAILGLFPIFAALLNGFVMGMVSGAVVESEGVGYLLAGVAPHGIFELPAILVAIGLGLKLGYLIISTIISILLSKPTRDNDFKIFFRELKPALMVIVLLLCIAAFVEVLITPAFITIAGG